MGFSGTLMGNPRFVFSLGFSSVCSCAATMPAATKRKPAKIIAFAHFIVLLQEFCEPEFLLLFRLLLAKERLGDW
jgi:hypothetical protein